MTARDFFYRRSGSLRAPWQWAGFLIVTFSTSLLAARIVFVLWPSVPPEALIFWALLLGLIVAHLVMLRGIDRGPWSAAGLARRQAAPSRLVVGFAAGALGILLPSGVLLFAHELRAEPAIGASGSWGGFALSMALFFLPQSLGEEMLVRGYLFTSTRDAIGWPAALAITSVLFGLLHLFNPGANALSVGLVMCAGAFLGAIRLVVDSLYASWMTHFAWNWSMVALLHATVSGQTLVPAPGYRVTSSGPAWLTGGAWGPEGGLGALAGMSVCLIVLVAWHRRARSQVHPERMAS